MSTPAEWEAHFAALGLSMVHSYDTQVMLAAVREKRHRYDGHEQIEAAARLAAAIGGQLRDDVPDADRAQAADVLLAISGYMATLATAGVSANAITNIIAFVAEGLAKEAGP